MGKSKKVMSTTGITPNSASEQKVLITKGCYQTNSTNLGWLYATEKTNELRRPFAVARKWK